MLLVVVGEGDVGVDVVVVVIGDGGDQEYGDNEVDMFGRLVVQLEGL